MKIKFFKSSTLLDDVYDGNYEMNSMNYNDENEDDNSDYKYLCPSEREQLCAYNEVWDKYMKSVNNGYNQDIIDHSDIIDKKANWEYHQTYKKLIVPMRKELICRTLLTFTKRILKYKKYIGKNNIKIDDIKSIYYYMPSFLFPIYNERIFDIDIYNNDLDCIAQNEKYDHNYMDFILPYGRSYYPAFSDTITVMYFIMNNEEIYLINNKVKGAFVDLQEIYKVYVLFRSSAFEIESFHVPTNYKNFYYVNKMFAKYKNNEIQLVNNVDYEYNPIKYNPDDE